MVFSSLLFLTLFFPLTVIIYYVIPNKFKNMWLMMASIAFYALGEPKFVFLFMAEILWNWAAALIMACLNSKSGKILVLIICLVGDLGMLTIFKYSRFFVHSINDMFGVAFALPSVALPIGISFYTFQEISYVVDVYRGEVPRKNLIDIALYFSFFPQLIAGPIIRYRDIAPQLQIRKTSWNSVSGGFIRFCTGLCKKILLANQLSAVADYVFGCSSPKELSSPMLWMGAIAYSLQLFFDFSGYSDMAIGLGAMFGFCIPENFHDPYIARTAKDFWNRWHISLSSWFREYVYFPLGGSRKGRWKTIRNLMIVWILTGLWHGANWTFILWGLSWGILIILEQFFICPESRRVGIQVFYRVAIGIAIVFLWTVFRSPNVSFAVNMLNRMISPTAWTLSIRQLPMIRMWWHEMWIYLLAGLVLSFRLPQQFCSVFLRGAKATVWLEPIKLLTLALCTTLVFSFLVNGSYNPFLYFQF